MVHALAAHIRPTCDSVPDCLQSFGYDPNALIHTEGPTHSGGEHMSKKLASESARH